MFDKIAIKIISIFLSVVGFFSGPFMKALVDTDQSDRAERIYYADGINTVYDLYIPGDVGDSTDVVFAIHGGAWMFGTQTMFTEYCERLAGEYGVTAVTMDYSRLLEGATAADMTDEIDTCIRHVIRTLAEKGIAIDHFFMTGHSAGAHLALLYGYTHYQDCPVQIDAIAAFSAPSDLMDDGDSPTIMGGLKWLTTSVLSGILITPASKAARQSYIDAINPIAQVSPEVPPTILIQGDHDTMVPYHNSVQLFEALQAAGVKSAFVTIPEADHFLSQFDNFEPIAIPELEAFASEILAD